MKDRPMKVKNVVSGLVVLATLSANAFADGARVYCAKNTAEVSQFATVEEYQPILFENGIQLATTVSDLKNIDDLLFEYSKFPETLRQEMMNAGSRLSLIEGNGVSEDPKWILDAKAANPAQDPFWTKTFDNRDWSTVKGAGGSSYGSVKVPTRVVVNSLYKGHGSINLVLHEHAHSLDAIYKLDTLSQSEHWKALMSSNADKVPSFLSTICGDYCVNNHQEGFAELFAYYHACDESRTHMENNIPAVADYFRDLVSVEDLKPVKKSVVLPSPKTNSSPNEIKMPKMPDLSNEVKVVKKGFSWIKNKVKNAIDDVL